MSSMSRLSGRIIGGPKRDDAVAELVTGHQLAGHPVISPLGERLGEIRDVLIDIASGRVVYAVLDFDCFVGVTDKCYAVPWVALTLDADNRCFILHVDKRRLPEAPCFDKDCWPTLADAPWAEQVHRFYSAEPFWRYLA